MRSYGSLSLTEASPAQTFSEPLTLLEVKEYLNLPERSPVDGEEDLMLEGFIIGAREVAEILGDKNLIVKQYDLALDYFSHEIELRTPLVSVDLVRRRDSDGAYTNLTEGTDYIVDLARGLITTPYNTFWPSYTEWPSSSVLVRFTSGYGPSHPFWSNAGQRVLVGMKQLISHWYNGRLPFEVGFAVNEYPYSVTALLGYGSIPRVG